jgi:hypothetical protein
VFGIGSAEVIVLLIVVLAILLYLLPTYVAGKRKHPQLGPIALVNILLGWSLLGWVAALAWALTGAEAAPAPPPSEPAAH